MTTQTKRTNALQDKAWSTMIVREDGTPELDKCGLTKAEAAIRRQAIAGHVDGEPFLLSPPEAENQHEDDNFGVVCMVGGTGYIHAIGITKRKANQLAKKAMKLCGPDAPVKKGVEPLVIDATYVFDMTRIMWQLNLATVLPFKF